MGPRIILASKAVTIDRFLQMRYFSPMEVCHIHSFILRSSFELLGEEPSLWVIALDIHLPFMVKIVHEM